MNKIRLTFTFLFFLSKVNFAIDTAQISILNSIQTASVKVGTAIFELDLGYL